MKFLASRWTPWMPAQSTWLERVILLMLVVAPLFYLSVSHWITNVSILCAVLILLSSVFYRNYFSVYHDVELWPFLGTYVIYFIAISVSQIGRGTFVSKEYLDQTRWLLGVPIFAFLLYLRIKFSDALRWIAPLIVLFSWVSSTFVMPSDAWGNRATIEFMDPLAFGFMNLSVGLMCLVIAALNLKQGRLSKLAILNVVGFMVGTYLSLRSGSRTGWLAFPFVLLLIARTLFENPAGKKISVLLFLALPLVAVLLLSSTTDIRLAAFVDEVSSYPWRGGVASDTSVGMRITFYRLGAYYFSQSPWFGWGDRGYLAIKDATEVVTFSTAYTRDFAYNALFHSEWTTQAVRFGLLGLIAVFWVFAVPFYVFFKHLRSHPLSAQASLMGLAFLMCQLAASFSTEIYSSKGMITFSVVIVAGLLADVLTDHARTDC
ncbi:O-antigen ligase family protein [Rhodoferax saidenbachensis]|uniref:O-antigen ligase n=1 Tax=Rhodoferax saidenbachensis TaxID=1484693 RepID=A0ABU1ZIA9_9BURK|nr:O-antigen ligase family protein [Rhodoferax saidenbachensis]MDR7305274.1 O-antigen ligase [Rhodoferax saidenbachensis]